MSKEFNRDKIRCLDQINKYEIDRIMEFYYLFKERLEPIVFNLFLKIYIIEINWLFRGGNRISFELIERWNFIIAKVNFNQNL